MISGDMGASVSVSGALFSRRAFWSALDITFLWQLAQLLLKMGCAAMRAAGPAVGNARGALGGPCAFRQASVKKDASVSRRSIVDIESILTEPITEEVPGVDIASRMAMPSYRFPQQAN